MLQSDYHLASIMMDMKVDEILLQAETDRLLHQAGVGRRGWLSRQGCWLLSRLGCGLVALGQRLQQIDVPQSLSFGSAQVEGGHRALRRE
jgi:hypothetical protein